MSDRGRLSGFCWHEEYHTIDRKKEKAANCIYLTEDRICRNSKCVQYGEKCFVATHCPYRIREKKQDQKSNTKTGQILKINCTIPVGSIVYSQIYGKGKYLSFDKQFRIISVKYETGVKRFQYPEAYLEGHICSPGAVYQRVQKDIQTAVRE